MCKCEPSAWWQFCPFMLCRRCIVGRVRLKTKGHNRSSGGQNMSMDQAAKNAGSPCELPDMNANASVHSLWFPVLNVVGICRLFMVVISSHIGLLHYAIFRLKKHTLSTDVRVCLFTKMSFPLWNYTREPRFPSFSASTWTQHAFVDPCEAGDCEVPQNSTSKTHLWPFCD